ncbi:hypothetical protein Tco_0107700, partial [Tanacetum coccineum]
MINTNGIIRKLGHRKLSLQRGVGRGEDREILYLMIKSFRSSWSPPKHSKDKTGLDDSVKLTLAKLNKRSGDAGLSKDKSGLELPLEFRRSWYVEGHIRSRVISFVLMQR